MRAWPEPSMSDHALVRLGVGPAVRVHDTRTREIREQMPEATARLYACGITPYDATHLGHAATYLAFDLLYRAWRAAGLDVHYVQNVTDVDDPLLERARATGEDWRALADREIELFRHDMSALRMWPPREYIGAVEAIPLIDELIGRLEDADSTYRVDDDLYFRVRADPAFGDVSGLSADEMRAAFGRHGGDPDRAGKEDPLDCILWLAERPGEPAWTTRLGRGRPGWHIECAAIALHYLGREFDVQGGGSDLAFPHHEMSAGHAQVAHRDDRFARAYVHAGLVGYQGEKMSKSLGNLVLVSQLRQDGVDPRAIRLALLAHHYRADWEWTGHDLAAARERLASWTAAVAADRPDAESTARAVRARLADDLDAPGALALLDAWADQPADAGAEAGAGALVASVVDASLGIDL
jgi:L-cysteine:1D-myo-inositol 2-amino-2-deoxy-alpha-D-glucopyranoside ligase